MDSATFIPARGRCRDDCLKNAQRRWRPLRFAVICSTVKRTVQKTEADAQIIGHGRFRLLGFLGFATGLAFGLTSDVFLCPFKIEVFSAVAADAELFRGDFGIDQRSLVSDSGCFACSVGINLIERSLFMR